MTTNDFRQLALALPEAVESAHMNHPDFRVGGKVFATLGYPNKEWGMVKLTPEQQHYFSKDHPDIFVPVKGAWGRKGATSVMLKAAKEDSRAAGLALGLDEYGTEADCGTGCCRGAVSVESARFT